MSRIYRTASRKNRRVQCRRWRCRHHLYLTALVFGFLLTPLTSYAERESSLSTRPSSALRQEGQIWQFQYSLEGLSGSLRKQVIDYLQLPDPDRIHPYGVRRFCRRAPSRIKEALSTFGYYAPTVAAHFESHDETLQCDIEVTLHEPVRIRSVEIQIEGEGAQSPPFNALLLRLPLKKGDPLSHAHYERAKSELSELATALGYFDMKIHRSAVHVYPDELAADVKIDLDTGERYRFGAVVFAQGPLSEEFLQRFIGFEQNDPYEARRVLKLRQELMESRYFHSVRVDRLADENVEKEMLIYVDYEMAPKFNYTAGVGVGTDIGPRIGLGVENRYVGEMGNRYQVTSLLSKVRKELGYTYMIPRTTPFKDRYELAIAYRGEEVSGVGSDLFSFKGQRVYVRDGRWTQIQSLRYQQENSRVAGESKHSRLLIPGIQWRQGKSTDLIYPKRGWRALFDIGAGHEALLSDTSFIQGRTELKWISSPIDKTRLIIRGEAGGTWVDRFEDLPASLRFFAGGDQSVRGYQYKSLGPSEAGQVVGGRYLLTSSVEVDRLLAARWGVAAFIDWGNAFDHHHYTLKKSVGGGVRWYSPVGPIRLDVAWPAGDARHSYRIHLSMGPDI